MKKIMYPLFFLFCFVLSSASFPQLNFEENFSYPAGDSLNTHGWVPHSQPGVNPVMIVAGSLSYPDYASSGIGNSVNVIGSAALVSLEDLTVAFNIDSVSNVYCSFLVKVASVGSQIDYFFHFREDPVPSILRGRVMLRAVAGNQFNFGISKGSTTVIDWDTTARNFEETYLIVLKYEYVAGVNNDLIHLFVNPSLALGEPASPDATVPDTSASDIIVNAISLRQGSRDYAVQLDGIRVSTSWTYAPLPVELSGFSALLKDGNVLLNWTTSTETNNRAFEIERKSDKSDYYTIAVIKGSGTTSETKHYSYADSKVQTGNYTYRLKQIDFDGNFTYSKEVEVFVNAPQEFALEQNYPNPFNPSTKIKYSVPQLSNVILKVFDVLGNEIETLVSEEKPAGVYESIWNAPHLPSGIYFCKMQAGQFSETRKLILMK